MSEQKSDALRLQMINGQLRTSDVNDLELLEAFAAVPREAFAAVARPALVYADGEIASLGPPGRKLLSPRTLGLLMKAAAPARGERALVVGDGAGYGAAILRALGLDVVLLETDAAAARRAPLSGVDIVEGPLDSPPEGKGPFDVILINGAFEETPARLVAALKEGGRLVGLRARQSAKRVVVFERFAGAVGERALYDAAGEVLPGLARAPAFAF
jgi:protein-L-isoaspartate(D-aspartate) O-methyltransferase